MGDDVVREESALRLVALAEESAGCDPALALRCARAAFTLTADAVQGRSHALASLVLGELLASQRPPSAGAIEYLMAAANSRALASAEEDVGLRQRALDGAALAASNAAQPLEEIAALRARLSLTRAGWELASVHTRLAAALDKAGDVDAALAALVVAESPDAPLPAEARLALCLNALLLAVQRSHARAPQLASVCERAALALGACSPSRVGWSLRAQYHVLALLLEAQTGVPALAPPPPAASASCAHSSSPAQRGSGSIVGTPPRAGAAAAGSPGGSGKAGVSPGGVGAGAFGAHLSGLRMAEDVLSTSFSTPGPPDSLGAHGFLSVPELRTVRAALEGVHALRRGRHPGSAPPAASVPKASAALALAGISDADPATAPAIELAARLTHIQCAAAASLQALRLKSADKLLQEGGGLIERALEAPGGAAPAGIRASGSGRSASVPPPCNAGPAPWPALNDGDGGCRAVAAAFAPVWHALLATLASNVGAAQGAREHASLALALERASPAPSPELLAWYETLCATAAPADGGADGGRAGRLHAVECAVAQLPAENVLQRVALRAHHVALSLGAEAQRSAAISAAAHARALLDELSFTSAAAAPSAPPAASGAQATESVCPGLVAYVLCVHARASLDALRSGAAAGADAGLSPDVARQTLESAYILAHRGRDAQLLLGVLRLQVELYETHGGALADAPAKLAKFREYMLKKEAMFGAAREDARQAPEIARALAWRAPAAHRPHAHAHAHGQSTAGPSASPV